MKVILLCACVINLAQFSHAGVTLADLSKRDASIKKQWEDESVEQQTQTLEGQREDAEYILKNIDKKCSELKDIPEYTKLHHPHTFKIPQKKFGPNDICFPSSTRNMVLESYRTLGDYEKELAEMRRSHGLDPMKMAEFLTVLISEARYREAEKFFPEFVNAVFPYLTKEEVIKKIKNREPIPEYLSKGLVADYWNQILNMQDKPDDLGKLNRIDDEIEDTSERMHRYFYSKDATKKAKALDFYRDNKIKFMIEKAGKTWKGDLKNKADKYFEDLQKSTTTQ